MPSQKEAYALKEVDYIRHVCVPCVEIWPPNFCVLLVSLVFPFYASSTSHRQQTPYVPCVSPVSPEGSRLRSSYVCHLY